MAEFLINGLAGFIFWTITLSPYMLFVVKTTKIQYWKWVAMEIVICGVLIPPSLLFIDWFRGLLL